MIKSVTTHHLKIISPTKKLKTLIDTKNFTVLSNEALHKWNEEATVRDDVEKKYLSLIDMIKRANHLQGMFPVNNSIYVNLGGKTYYPQSMVTL